MVPAPSTATVRISSAFIGLLKLASDDILHCNSSPITLPDTIAKTGFAPGGFVKYCKFRALLFVSIPVLALAAGAAAQTAPTPQNDPNMKEIFSYTLTMDKIHKLTAVEKDMAALQKAHPEMQKQMDADNSDGNLDQLTQKIQKYPEV